jgi:hypothetical protein
MISGSGWLATYHWVEEGPDGKDRHRWVKEPIVYFDSDGVGWVAEYGSEMGSAFVPARDAHYPTSWHEDATFDGYERDDRTIVQMLPADRRTRAVYKDDEREEVVPVFAWGLVPSGRVFPLCVTSQGDVMKVGRDDLDEHDPSFVRLDDGLGS